ncbi:unnamed protein product [Echinostoma caproni]|uniref:Nudix hydrolase domain-containing protein n=1 Tax=Echinostoma caproni TaxID=27848 RepID=A0A3P8LC59_9TREM|nr:unnamed protein product [Echinostoma caproni]
MDHPLFLLVKQSCEDEPPVWGLPVIPVREGHTLRQTADLLAENYIPAAAKCRIFGNAPSAVHVYRYRDAKTGERFGVQMYFFNAYVDRTWHGEDLKIPISSSAKNISPSDHVWIRAQELDNYVQDRKMLRVFKSFMIEY